MIFYWYQGFQCMVPMYGTKIFPIPLHHHHHHLCHQLELLIHTFMFLPNSGPTTWMPHQKSSLIRSANIFLDFYCPIFVIFCSLGFSFLSDMSDTGMVFCCCSSPAYRFDMYIQRCSVYFIYIYMLYMNICSSVKNSYFTYSCNISLKQSDHLTLASFIKRGFLPTKIFFLFLFWPFFVNLRWLCLKIIVDQQSLNYSDLLVWH